MRIDLHFIDNVQVSLGFQSHHRGNCTDVEIDMSHHKEGVSRGLQHCARSQGDNRFSDDDSIICYMYYIIERELLNVCFSSLCFIRPAYTAINVILLKTQHPILDGIHNGMQADVESYLSDLLHSLKPPLSTERFSNPILESSYAAISDLYYSLITVRPEDIANQAIRTRRVMSLEINGVQFEGRIPALSTPVICFCRIYCAPYVADQHRSCLLWNRSGKILKEVGVELGPL
jgi:hypothetical protein